MNNLDGSEFIDDDLWDHYSGLPSPAWYQHIKEQNEKDNHDNSIPSGNADKQI